MAKQFFSTKYNSCKIEIKAFGIPNFGTGFIYKTSHQCKYDYVLTAKHLFCQEDDTSVNLKAIDMLKVYRTGDNCPPIDVEDFENDICTFEEKDIAIIRIKKIFDTRIVRVQVRDLSTVEKDYSVEAFSYPTFSPEEVQQLSYRIPDPSSFSIRMEENNLPQKYQIHGISGSGVCDKDHPYMYGIISMYSYSEFQLADIKIAKIKWADINDELKKIKWEPLDCNDTKTRCLTKNKSMIKDLEEMYIRGACLNMKRAIDLLRYDTRDDWYFDPLRFKDKLNSDYVLDYFDSEESRENYTPEKYEVFFKPKKDKPVLRKAMVGTFIDQLIYIAIADKLSPLMQKEILPCIYHAQINPNKSKGGLIVSGIEQWKKMNYLIYDWTVNTKNIKKKKGSCIVKVDLFNYYDSINKNKLLESLHKICKNEDDEKTVELLEVFLTNIDDKTVVAGIPQQCDASAVFATFYLSKVDAIMSNSAVHYCRFMDDIYIVAEDKYQARGLLQLLETELRNLGLFINPQKVELYSTTQEKNHLIKSFNLYNHGIESIRCLSKSSVKSDRMNACSMMYEKLKTFNFGKDEDDREYRYYLNLLSYQNLHFTKAQDYLEVLKKAIIGLKDKYQYTDLLCRVIASFYDAKVDGIKEILEEVKKNVLHDEWHLSDWQLYNLWLLLAYTRNNDERLVHIAQKKIIDNPEGKSMVVSAMILYIGSVQKTATNIFYDYKYHGNYQKRILQVATRCAYPQSFKDEADKLDHQYLFNIKDKKLVYLRLPSFISENGEETVEEFYSGK